MTLIGLDFDNTLIDYDEAFYEIASKNNLIRDESVLRTKNSVREHLNGTGRREEFTRIQGQVYGREISKAKPMEGMMEALKLQREKGAKLIIISHKTKKPLSGEDYDMHQSAIKWMKNNNFFATEGLGLRMDQIYFEETKEKKIERIHSLNCDVYIDDLREIVKQLNTNIKRIQFKRNEEEQEIADNWKCMRHWCELENIMDGRS